MKNSLTENNKAKGKTQRIYREKHKENKGKKKLTKLFFIERRGEFG